MGAPPDVSSRPSYNAPRYTGETGTILKVEKNETGASRATILTDMSSKEVEVSRVSQTRGLVRTVGGRDFFSFVAFMPCMPLEKEQHLGVMLG